MNLKRVAQEQHPFTFDKSAVSDKRLNNSAFRLYLFLKSVEKDGEVSAFSLEDLAGVLCVSAQTVKANVKTLNKLGYISSVPGNGKGHKYVHTMLK